MQSRTGRCGRAGDGIAAGNSRSPEARYDHRLHGLLLVCHGFSAREVAQAFGDASRTGAYWVQRFKVPGLAGSQEGERNGRPATLSATGLTRPGRDLRCASGTFGYGQTLWDGPLLRHHLRAAYAVALGVRQCHRLFHRLGFRRRKPRPPIAQPDPVTQAEYKRTPPPRRSRRRGPVGPR